MDGALITSAWQEKEEVSGWLAAWPAHRGRLSVKVFLLAGLRSFRRLDWPANGWTIWTEIL